MNYYNDNDPAIVRWLEELISAGELPAGVVDGRSIHDVVPDDLQGFHQCHFFAGIGGWPLALRRVAWPDDRPVWTGSPPCQAFSGVGRSVGFDDPRHLWPELFRLIVACRPGLVVGEQVASALTVGRVGGGIPGDHARTWLDLVCDDLESAHYTGGAVIAPACSVGASHIRQRLYWCGVADTHRPGLEGHAQHGHESHEPGWHAPEPVGRSVDTGGGNGTQWAHLSDGTVRPVEPGTFPLVAGLPRNVVHCGRDGSTVNPADCSEAIRTRLAGYGNAVHVDMASAFLQSIIKVGTP